MQKKKKNKKEKKKKKSWNAWMKLGCHISTITRKREERQDVDDILIENMLGKERKNNETSVIEDFVDF